MSLRDWAIALIAGAIAAFLATELACLIQGCGL